MGFRGSQPLIQPEWPPPLDIHAEEWGCAGMTVVSETPSSQWDPKFPGQGRPEWHETIRKNCIIFTFIIWSQQTLPICWVTHLLWREQMLCPQHHWGGSHPAANLCGQSHPKSWWRQETWARCNISAPCLLFCFSSRSGSSSTLSSSLIHLLDLRSLRGRYRCYRRAQ